MSSSQLGIICCSTGKPLSWGATQTVLKLRHSNKAFQAQSFIFVQFCSCVYICAWISIWIILWRVYWIPVASRRISYVLETRQHWRMSLFQKLDSIRWDPCSTGSRRISTHIVSSYLDTYNLNFYIRLWIRRVWDKLCSWKDLFYNVLRSTHELSKYK